MRIVPAPQTTADALLKADETALAAYEKTGAIVVRGLIGRDWIDGLRNAYAGMAEVAASPSGAYSAQSEARRLTTRSGMWQDDEDFRAFLFSSPIARAAATAMRSQFAQLYEDLLITEPSGSATHSSWHQDAAGWPLSGRMLSSVWLSLDSVQAESGAMRFVEGSHRGPFYQPLYLDPKNVGDDALRWTGGTFPKVDEDQSVTIVQTETEPGDAVIFHPGTIHCAYGSSKERDRRSFTIRFLGDDVRWYPTVHMYHAWMRDLPLKRGDKVVSERLPLVWETRPH